MPNQKQPWLLSAFTLVLLTIILLAVIVVAFNKTTEIRYEEKEIPQFSVDVHYEPYPKTIDIENKIDCNATHLHTCILDDPTTLFGCKELIVRCHHFDKDTDYLANGEKYTVPKNTNANEGYALAINVVSEACNPYHGDLTLVALNADSDEYMLICTCKNPGYIGNENILGACDTVYICDGSIDDINMPLDKISCKCPSIRERTVRYDDGLPVCKQLLVTEANELYDDWTHLVPWVSDRLIDVNVYNHTIGDNIKCSRLLDPCKNALDNPNFMIPGGSYSPQLKTCHFSDYGLPLSVGLFGEPAKLSNNNDDDRLTSIDSALATDRYKFIRFSDNIAGQRKLLVIKAALDVKWSLKDEQVFMQAPPGIGFGLTSQIDISHKNKMYAPKCHPSWPKYSCKIGQYYSRNLNGVPISDGEEIPWGFAWKISYWYDCEFLLSKSFKSNFAGLAINQQRFTAVRDARTYGILIYNDNQTESNGIASFNKAADYTMHKNVLT